MKRAANIVASIGLVALLCVPANAAEQTSPILAQSVSGQLSQGSGGNGGGQCRKRCERGYNKCMSEAGGGNMRGGSQGRGAQRCVKRREYCLRNICGISG